MSQMELTSVCGGYDAEKCSKLQKYANENASKMDDVDWELWTENYYKYC